VWRAPCAPTNRCRVVLDTNRYSVPALYASARLTLKLFADRLCIYHGANFVATHPRSYGRHRDFENPDHIKELLDQRRKARDAKLLLRLSLRTTSDCSSPHAGSGARRNHPLIDVFPAERR
jgi:hypothetical protein